MNKCHKQGARKGKGSNVPMPHEISKVSCSSLKCCGDLPSDSGAWVVQPEYGDNEHLCFVHILYIPMLTTAAMNFKVDI